MVLEVAWVALVNDLDALPTVRESTVCVEIEMFGWQLMVHCRIGIDYCASHLRVVDLNYRLQNMTFFWHSFFIFLTRSKGEHLTLCGYIRIVLYSHHFR